MSKRQDDGKPKKPRPDFPLFPHDCGQWAKKIRGRLVYFGVWADPDAALAKYLDERDDLYAGRQPRGADPGVTVADLMNAFLDAKWSQHEQGELSRRMFDDYRTSCNDAAKSLGLTVPVASLRPEDFARARADAAARFSPVVLGVWIQRVRTAFKWAFDSETIDKPVRTGPGFAKPSRRVTRLHRQAAGPKIITADVARQLIDVASSPLNAMILLGLNCGFGQSDCSELPRSAVDLKRGWIDFPRPKTGIARRCPLWPETIAALKVAYASRPEPKDPADAGLVFVTKYGHRWVRANDHGPERRAVPIDAVSLLFHRLVVELGVTVPGRFYTLRHTFRTIADGSKDRVAIDILMGHDDPSVGAGYRESVDDSRLIAVVNCVRAWVWPKRGQLD